METNTKLTIGTFITLALILSGIYYVSPGDIAYHCEAKDTVMICEKLSSGIGTRCYYEDTYKICKEGWEELEPGQIFIDEPEPQPAPNPTPVSSGGIKWECSPTGCIKIE